MCSWLPPGGTPVNFAASRYTASGLLVLLCLLLNLPGLTAIPPIDRDEARFAQASHQMLESKDYVRIYFQDEPRHKKPIGIYWLQVLSVKLFSAENKKEIWPYRIPSVLGALLAVLGTYAIGRRLFEAREALLGSALLACSLLLVVEAHQATTDAALLAAIVASQWALADLYAGREDATGKNWPAFLVFWSAQGAGILLKGPIVLMVSAFTVLSLGFWDRNWRWLRSLQPLPGVLLLFLLVLPWSLAVWKATDGAFFQDAFRGDFFPKLISGQESHGAPPGYYLLLLPVAFWPASALLGVTCRHAWKERTCEGVKFCICWIVPSWIVFEMVPTKLPHYVLPLYPALALLSARAILEFHRNPGPWPKFWPRRVPLFFMGLFGVLVLVGALILPWIAEGRPLKMGILTALLGFGIAAQGIRLLSRGQPLRAVTLCIAGNVVVFGLLLQAVLPQVDAMWLSRSIQQKIPHWAPAAEGKIPRVVSAGYHEPSLVFLVGTETRLVTPEAAALSLTESPETLSIVWDRELPRFLDKAEELGVAPKFLGSVEGFNYSKGRKMTLNVYTRGVERQPMTD